MQSRNASWLGRALGIFVVLVLVLGALVAAMALQQRRSSLERERTRDRASVALARSSMRTALHAAKADLRMLAGSPSLQSALADAAGVPAARAMLQRVRRVRPEDRGLSLLDASGRTLVTTGATESMAADAVAVLRPGSVRVQPASAAARAMPALHLATGIYGAHGRLLGVLAVTLDDAALTRQLAHVAALSGGHLWLLDGQGRPLYGSGAQGAGTALPATQAALRERMTRAADGQVTGTFGRLTFATVALDGSADAPGGGRALHVALLVPLPPLWPAPTPHLLGLAAIALLVLAAVSALVARQQVQLRAARRETETNSRLLTDIFQHSAWMMQVKDRHGRILRINDAGARLIGRKREELEGASIESVASADTVARVAEHDAEILSSHRVTQHEERVDYVGGSYSLLTTRFPVTDSRGRVVGVGAMSVDISARILGEEALRLATAEAESANRTKSAFLASMSHELRTPLNSIIGLSELLMEDLQDAGQDERTEPLRRVIQAGRHLLVLINEILEFSRVEAGRIQLDLHAVDVNELVEEVAATLRPLALANGNRLTVTIESAVTAVHADATRLRQVLVNLVGNATKFTRDGDIGVYVGLIPRPGGRDQVTFVVSDSGIGMDEEQLQHVFEPFQQSDASIARRYGGTGLGLSISHQLVHLMGGDIEVDSAPGRGSAFTVRLPAADPAPAMPAVAPPRAGTAARRPRLRVLVADDDADARYLLARALQPLGVDVVMAASGAEALACVRERHPDLMLLDIALDDMSGLDVLRELRADTAAGELPVILCTVTDHDQHMMALGVIEHLSRPMDTQRLGRLVRYCMQPDRAGAVLIADADPAFRAALAVPLREQGHEVLEAQTREQALSLLRGASCALLVVDPAAKAWGGLDLVRQVRGEPGLAGTAVILATARPLSSEDAAELARRALALVHGQNGGHRAILERVHAILQRMDEADLPLQEGA